MAMPGIVILVLTSLALSADAFAAALARSCAHGGAPSATRLGAAAAAVRLGAVFGAVEGTMCLAGYLLVAGVAGVAAALISALDHWIALAILSVVGIRMVRGGLAPDADRRDGAPRAQVLGSTVLVAVGSSIDSAAAGGAFALAGAAPVVALAVGGASFVMSSLGAALGPRIGARFGGAAEIAGGLVLIAVGAGIVADHEGLMRF